MNYKHGKTNTRIYKIYIGILSRTTNPKVKSFKDYGARGIQCLWKSFEEFYRDMGSSYRKNLTIERIDNNGNYSKKNCKWILRKEQRRNRRDNRFITIKGETLLLKEWAKEYRLPYARVYMRITRLGWTIEEALGLVPKKRWLHTSKI